MSDEIQGVDDLAPEDGNEEQTRVLNLSMEGVKTEFEPLPIGVYEATVFDAEYVAESKKSGKPYVKIIFKVEDEEYQDRRLFANFSLAEKALWKLAKTLEALGYEIPDGDLQLDLDELEGLPCKVSVTVDEYQGKTTNPVQDVLPAG